MYLNEFDQCVLHTLKPLGYARYGDDFVLWFPGEAEARTAQVVGSQFLADYPGLTVNPRHDSVQPTAQRLRFLGVDLWPHGRRLTPRTQRRIRRNLSMTNLSSYQSLIQAHQPGRYQRRFTAQKFDIMDDVW